MGHGKRVLVCGATGYLGRYVVHCAHERGHQVRALVRDAERLGDARAACDEVFEGQATRSETLEGLCDGVDVVVSALGNRTLARRPTCWEVDYGANMNIVERARLAGVEQVVFVSVLRGAEVRHRVPQIDARERVVDALVGGTTPYTIIRPSGFFNDMSEILEMARKSGTVWLVGDGDNRLNPIHGEDLAEVVVDAIGNPEALGEQIDAGGPDVLRMRELAELAFEALGKPARVRSLPIWLVGATAKVVQPFNVNVASLIAMFVALTGQDAVTDCYGEHHLADFFRERVAASAEGTAAVR